MGTLDTMRVHSKDATTSINVTRAIVRNSIGLPTLPRAVAHTFTGLRCLHLCTIIPNWQSTDAHTDASRSAETNTRH